MFRRFGFFLLLSSCSHLGHGQTRYPGSWWTQVPESERKSWEILPQDAAPGEVILSKRTELGIFSNLAQTPFDFEAARYASIEGFWQYLKYPEEILAGGETDPRTQWSGWVHSRKAVAALSGFEAKHAGDIANELMKKNGITWVSYQGEKFSYRDGNVGSQKHLELIIAVTKQKILQTPGLKELLEKITRELKSEMPNEKSPMAYIQVKIVMIFRAFI